MKIYLLSILLLISGCTLIQFGKNTDKVQQIPSKPIYQQPEMQIGKQQAVDVIVQLAEEADKLGIEAKSKQSDTLLTTAKIIQIIEGIPVDRISWQDSDKIKELLEDLKTMEQDYRTKVTEWELLMQQIAEDESKLIELHNSNNTLRNWIVGLLVLLAIFCFLFPSIGVPLVMHLIKKAKTLATKVGEEAVEATKEQFGQVVSAIEETKKRMKEKDPDLYNHMIANLKKHTDTRTRDTIAEIKNHKQL